jgi:hypothetical protein
MNGRVCRSYVTEASRKILPVPRAQTGGGKLQQLASPPCAWVERRRKFKCTQRKHVDRLARSRLPCPTFLARLRSESRAQCASPVPRTAGRSPRAGGCTSLSAPGPAESTFAFLTRDREHPGMHVNIHAPRVPGAVLRDRDVTSPSMHPIKNSLSLCLRPVKLIGPSCMACRACRIVARPADCPHVRCTGCDYTAEPERCSPPTRG